MQLERKGNELDTTKQRQTLLQDKLDRMTAECEQRLDLARDRERQLIAVSTSEMILVVSVGVSKLNILCVSARFW
jgi:hypothetical protein